MQEIINGLNKTKLLSEQDIIKLKNYIATKYPEWDSQRRAAILANAVHRILDQNLAEFDEYQRRLIRIKLLQNAVSQNQYNIFAGDVLRTCLLLQNSSEQFLNSLSSWVSARQDTPVAPELIKSFVLRLQPHLSLLESSGFEAIWNILENDGHETAQSPGSAQANADKDVQIALSVSSPVNIDETAIRNQVSDIQASLFEAGSMPANAQDSIRAHALPLIPAVLINITSSLISLQRLLQRYINKVSSVLRSLRWEPVWGRRSLVYGTAAIILIIPIIFWVTHQAMTMAEATGTTPQPLVENTNPLPDNLRYTEFDRDKLRSYLKTRDSLLAEEPYFSSIIDAGKEFDVNPLLLFAIAGQEQSFVPRSHPQAQQIANNPFNVYESWVHYNTNIKDSARIAAQTVVNLSKERPPYVHPVLWVNRRYAEDENWWRGVTTIFNTLQEQAGTGDTLETSSTPGH